MITIVVMMSLLRHDAHCCRDVCFLVELLNGSTVTSQPVDLMVCLPLPLHPAAIISFDGWLTAWPLNYCENKCLVVVLLAADAAAIIVQLETTDLSRTIPRTQL